MMRGNRRRQSNQDIDMHNLRLGFYNSNYNYNQDGLRVRDFSRGRGIICRYCNTLHYSQSDKCYFFCLYCQSIHLKKSTNNQKKLDKNMICPMLMQQALHQQNKKAFRCVTCDGNGSFQKIIQTTFLEPKAAFQSRLVQYEKLEKQGYTQLQLPHRKTFRTKLQSKQETCETCKGQGKIYKMTHCCQNGCPQCGFSKIKVNPKWRQIRYTGEDNHEAFTCIICCEEAEVGQKIFKMYCGHSFHRGCILYWLHMKEGCYKCSEVDPYLERQEFPEEYLNRSLLINSIMKQKDPTRRIKNISLIKGRDTQQQKQLKIHNFLQQYFISSDNNHSEVLERSQLQQSFYSLSFAEKSESQRQILQQQNALDVSFTIRQVISQNDQRDLSLNLSGIIKNELQENNHNEAQTIENTLIQNMISQAQKFIQQVQKKMQQVAQQAPEVQENQ